jgi:hypothetical protein
MTCRLDLMIILTPPLVGIRIQIDIPCRFALKVAQAHLIVQYKPFSEIKSLVSGILGD